jgi:UDP-glucose 4-epimerase
LLGRHENIVHLVGDDGFRFIESDVLDTAKLGALFEAEQFDCVFHLAANSDIAISRLKPGVDFDNTFRTTYCLLDAMRVSTTRKIVFASTSAIYGEAPGQITEDHGPLQPVSHYGAAKLASEAFISAYVENYGLRAWIIRFPNVVGPRSTHGAIFDFVNKLKKTPKQLQVLGNGSQEKPYLHVNDLVEAIMLAWEKVDEPLNIFNVGAAERTTVAEIARIVIEESGTLACINYSGGDRGWVGDVAKFDYDTSRIRALGWVPTMTSDEAVRTAAHWLFENTR